MAKFAFPKKICRRCSKEKNAVLFSRKRKNICTQCTRQQTAEWRARGMMDREIAELEPAGMPSYSSLATSRKIL